ncbi:MAG: tRNA lysidine(34) synthetase TilS [Planctomycetes bacterium]|nr:tRNA lysidine(34) synthetase TilS [Planctomycetota bacterium]
MAPLPHPLPADWNERWPRLAGAVGVEPSEPLVLGLSGGADSVLLLHWLCASQPRPAVLAVHVDHGLRGAESDADREFCAQLCRDNGVRFRARRIELAAGANLEARAREARYAVLAEEAARHRVRVLLTGHHSDDGLETLLLRWVRGSTLAGLHGPAERSRLGRLLLVRPLIGMRRAEIRTLLREAGLSWRDDSSNRDLRHTRNRVREEFLPALEQLGGAQALESLRKFAGAVEHLEQDLSRRTADLAWRPLSATRATRRAATSSLGGSLRRAMLARLPSALQRRTLWRLLVEGTARAPSRRLLGKVLDDLGQGRCARHALSGGWTLCLRARSLELHPPLEALGPPPHAAVQSPWLPFAEFATRAPSERRTPPGWIARLAAPEQGFVLPVPGSVTLSDGRRVVAAWVESGTARPIPRDARTVELELPWAVESLRVRWPRARDRFHPLGAPGSRALRRFLSDAGVPRGERRLVPLVFHGSDLLWVAGLRPAHPYRVQHAAPRRLRLELHDTSTRPHDPRARSYPQRDAATRQAELPFEPLAP